jgi:hypothetical protein
MSRPAACQRRSPRRASATSLTQQVCACVRACVCVCVRACVRVCVCAVRFWPWRRAAAAGGCHGMPVSCSAHTHTHTHMLLECKVCWQRPDTHSTHTRTQRARRHLHWQAVRAHGRDRCAVRAHRRSRHRGRRLRDAPRARHHGAGACGCRACVRRVCAACMQPRARVPACVRTCVPGLRRRQAPVVVQRPRVRRVRMHAYVRTRLCDTRRCCANIGA